MNLKTSSEIYDSARKLYSDRLHYHNFQHVLETLAEAERLLQQCESNNIAFNQDVICHAILFHDAGYEVNHKQIGYSSKEQYSAKLAADVLSEAGLPAEHIKAVEEAILCTRIDAVCCSVDENIVRAADLSGLASTYSQFREKTRDLYRERELLTGNRISWNKYKQDAFSSISKFIEFRIKLDIEPYLQDNYLFQQRVFNNLHQMMNDTFD